MHPFHYFLPRRRRRGAGLAGLLLLGAYIAAMWLWNLDIARHAATRELRERIVAWVDRQPIQPGGYTWEDLLREEVVSGEDAHFLHKHGHQYRPIGPDSPRGEILFLQVKTADDHRYVYKDGASGYWRRWPAPGGRTTLVDLPGPDHRKTSRRSVQFLSADPPGILGEFAIDGYQRPVLWNRSGSLAAMNAPLDGSDQPITLWRVGGGAAEVIPMPQNLTFDWLLSQEASHTETSYGMKTLQAESWKSDHKLRVFVQATGSYIDSATNQKMGFNLIYHVLLDASPAAGCRIESLSKQHFAASAFR
jgi:hypothetical protein